jgi:hypothetical protein
MGDFVQLYYRRNRGWPWPEDSWGLTPMYGEDGWCRSCGIPKVEQSGSLAIQRKGMARCDEVWVPNWQFDTFCLEKGLADKVAERFRVRFTTIDWRGSSPCEAAQLVVAATEVPWFDTEALRRVAIARHGTAGADCPECGIWRWMPLPFGTLPPLRSQPEFADADVAASPEWFGDGWNAFRQVLFRRELAEFIAAANPRGFEVRSVLGAT